MIFVPSVFHSSTVTPSGYADGHGFKPQGCQILGKMPSITYISKD